MKHLSIPVTPGTRASLVSFSGSEVDDASIIVGLQEAAGCCGIPPATFVQQYSSFFCVDHHAADCDRCDSSFQLESASGSFSRSSGGFTVHSHFSGALGADVCSQPDWLYGAEAYPSNEVSLSLPSSWSYNFQHPCQETFSAQAPHEQQHHHLTSCTSAYPTLPPWAVSHSSNGLSSIASHSSQQAMLKGSGISVSRFFAQCLQEGTGKPDLSGSQLQSDPRHSSDGSCISGTDPVSLLSESACPCSDLGVGQQ